MFERFGTLRPALAVLFAVLTLVFAIGGGLGRAHAAGGGGHDGGGGDVSGGSASFVALPPLSIPVIQRSTVHGFLQLEIVLKIDDPALQRQVRSLFPRLKDAYLRNMNAYAANHVRPGQKPDVESIGRTLQAITDYTLANNNTKVLFSQIMLQQTY